MTAAATDEALRAGRLVAVDERAGDDLSAAALRDGDPFRLGSQALVFRRSPGDGTTATEPER